MAPRPRLTPFAHAVLVLVGEGGAGPHDIVRMMRIGRWSWSASESQYYAEPKRLERLGLLRSRKEPGVTRERTVYELTDAGREELRAWLAEPTAEPRIQDEPVVRLLASEFVPAEVTLASLRPLRADLQAALRQVEHNVERSTELPHRAAVLHINHRLTRRLIEAHLEWLDEVEAELGR